MEDIDVEVDARVDTGEALACYECSLSDDWHCGTHRSVLENGLFIAGKALAGSAGLDIETGKRDTVELPVVGSRLKGILVGTFDASPESVDEMAFCDLEVAVTFDGRLVQL